MTPRRLIYCMDGTWQSQDQRHPTNVAKIARLVEQTPLQIVGYDPGVGTGWPRIAGGLFGSGIVKNIVEGYTWLKLRYRPGDLITVVGFSRGASSARELAGMLGQVGFDLTPANVWERYRAMYRTNNPIPVQAVAVFDTVGARGVPVGGGRWCMAPQFDDCDLGLHVKYGFHAVAIHERRKAFLPTLWTNEHPRRVNAMVEPAHPGIQQTWFNGWHSDVGGGAPDSRLSDSPLAWMINNLVTFAGVTIRPGYHPPPSVPVPNAPMHPPGFFTRLYGMADRILPPNAVIHPTATPSQRTSLFGLSRAERTP